MFQVNSLDQISILNFYHPLCFVLGLIISQKYQIKDYLYLMEKTIFIFAIFSLVGVVTYTFFEGIVQLLPNYTYYETTHKTAIIFNVLISEAGVIKRNVGMAWEPGAFQFLLNLGVYSYIKQNEYTNIWKLIIYGSAIVFTQSTIGLFIFLILTIRIFLKYKTARLFLLIAIPFLFESVLEIIDYQFSNKLFGSNSFDIRLKPMINAFTVGSRHLFGLGNSGYNLNLNSLSIGGFDSYSQIFIRYGYLLFSVMIYYLIKIFSYDKMLGLIIILTYFTQTIWYLPLITPLFFMSLSKE